MASPVGTTGQQSSSSLLAGCDWNPKTARRVELPDRIREVSGVAGVEDGTMLAHDDEYGVVYRVETSRGRILGVFPIAGAPVGDFEGIAVWGSTVAVITSDGKLYVMNNPRAGVANPARITETGVGRFCEIEGLAFEFGGETLLLACKIPRVGRLRGLVTIFRWSLKHRAFADPAEITIPLRALTGSIKARNFRPSSLDRDPVSGHLLVLSSMDQAIAELGTDGKVIQVRKLPRGIHRQPEGVTVLIDGTLVISDEGTGRIPPKLTLYRCER